ncbi:uncharacterized protein F4807DRAFT_456724 [Annulohypoxylon truncatum]|uniref:uncharacterized protein n=1 Tax=Annulohypoxylon truncatum TaxID=327061 RepID=UPI0020089069|nr:uncharacterized protein F4807DRAFT_456724 [Annulohypoxylon truncatum]KAI1213380.1 hypothetical protein F4807DRAFT_456724 [Annulohypoxylon truncatum]
MKFPAVYVALAVFSAQFALANNASIETTGQAAAPIAFVINCGGSGTTKGAGETCNTMCYGINCKFNTKIYNYDNPSDSTKKTRRTRAGCTNGKGKNKNPCKGNKNGDSCDEFPFASTKEADTKQQFYRCVSANDNSSQGGQLGNLYKNKCGKKSCEFQLGFSNESNFQYCKPKPSCKSDGNLFTKGNKPLKRDLEGDEEITVKPRSTGGYYRLRSGETFYSPSDFEIGTRAVYHNFNKTVVADLDARDLNDEDYFNALEIVEDEIIEKL